MLKSDIQRRIYNLDMLLDDVLEEGSEKLDMVIVGSSILILKEYIVRSTDDIDVYLVAGGGEIIKSFSPDFSDEFIERIDFELNINADVTYFDKLKNIFKILDVNYEKINLSEELENINLLSPPLEVLVITKIYAISSFDSSRQNRDYYDIDSDKVRSKVDMSKIEDMANKAAMALNKREANKFIQAYKIWLNKDINLLNELTILK